MKNGTCFHDSNNPISTIFSSLSPFPLAGERVLSAIHGIQEGPGRRRNYQGIITRFRRLGLAHGLVDMDDSNSIDEV